MDATDKNILEWTSDQNMRHMYQAYDIVCLLEGYYHYRQVGPRGTTWDQVKLMGTFQKIEILEEISRDNALQQGLPQNFMAEVSTLLKEVDKNGFRTADDI